MGQVPQSPDVIKLINEDVAVKSLTNFGNETIGGTLTIAGAMSPNGGYVRTGRSKYCTVQVGCVAYGSMGTNAVHVAGTIYYAELVIPRNFTVTGIGVLNGATVGTDNLVFALYDSAGTLLGNTALAGTLSAGADAFQEIALTAPVAVTGPGRYWIGVQCNGTTCKTRRIAASTFVDCLTKSATGTFGTLPALTVPTTFTADVGPIAYVY